MNKRLTTAIIALLVLVSMCFVSIYALDLSDVDANTSVSQWAYSSQSGHMGTKELTYAYFSSAVQAAYSSYVGGGIGLWGTNISMTCISDVDSAGLEIKVSNKITDATASTLVNSVDSETGHRTKCTITIYPNFDLTSHTYDGKIRTIAHELGHVYGLGHVTFTSSIMYGVYSTTKDVTSQDIWGMKVVTHIHSHGVLVLGTTYEFIDATYHYITCNSCKGKIKRVHTPDGNGVCSCGYTGPYVYP